MTPVSDTRTDVDLLARIAAGDSTALSALYDRHAGTLLGLICRIVRDRGEAEDILQDVFVRVWDRADTYNGALGSPGAWVSRIARNRAIDRLRARAARPELVDASLAYGNMASDQRSNPEARAKATEAQRALRTALASLNPDQRRLIEDAYYLGFSQSELASRFDLPLGTVKTRIRSGMLSLKSSLQGLHAPTTSEGRPQP